jgi:hypothetical protein
MRTKLETIIYSKLGWNDEIKNKKKNFHKKSQEQKLKIKIIRIKIEISTKKEVTRVMQTF